MRSFLLLVLTPLLLGMPYCALAGVVHADGIIRVKGGSWENARVTLIPEFGEPRVIERSSARFTLDLPLQVSYLLRAEYENAATKEIVFDLRVPSRYDGSEFTFPFEITLEVKESREVIPFAGPVGLVSFNTALEDLDYVTDHRLLAVSKKARELSDKVKRMEPAPASELTLPTPVPPPLNAIVTERSVPEQMQEEPAPEKISPLQSILPIAVMPEAPKPITVAVRSTTPIATAPEANSAPAEDTRPTSTTERSSKGSVAASIVTDKAVESRAQTLRSELTFSIPTVDCGQEQVLEYPSMLVAVRYIPLPNGNCDEMRKVTHAYGDVFYFQNGRAITQWEYDQLMAN